MSNAALGEVCTIVMGQAPVGDSYNQVGAGMPLIAGAGDFDGGAISPSKFTTKPGKVSVAGDIILSIRASIGAKVWADGEYCLGRGVAALREGPRLAAPYLWHWLSRYERDLRSKGRGATFLQISRSDIAHMPIVLPPLPEQRRIAAILDHADVLRAKRRQVLAHLDALPQAIFQNMFGAPQHWSGRWPLGTIGDMATSVQYGTSAKAGASGQWPILRMGNITDAGRIDLSDLKYLDLPPTDVASYSVRPGDLLFNRTNSKEKVGKTAVVRTQRSLAFAGYLVRVRFDNPAMAEYVSAYLNGAHGRAVRRRMAKAAVNQANINASEMRRIAIALPPGDLVEQFACRLREVEDQRVLVQQGSQVDDTLCASLQSRAFRGELR